LKPATSPSALKVQAVLGEDFEVLELETSTRTAAEAAAAIGCTVGQIAKSLIFRALDSGKPVLAIASGSVRVDEARLSEILGEDIGRADAAFVREQTGYAIGGVPPVGHSADSAIFIDETLLTFDTIWAAGGTPNAVFRLKPDDLVRLTGGTVAAIAE
jgi:prolyl-tRNA editing enzyme YbaK/EbsC (Cys-tRNA(Pro) deacylase)